MGEGKEAGNSRLAQGRTGLGPGGRNAESADPRARVGTWYPAEGPQIADLGTCGCNQLRSCSLGKTPSQGYGEWAQDRGTWWVAAWRVFQRDSPEQTPGVSKTQRGCRFRSEGLRRPGQTQPFCPGPRSELEQREKASECRQTFRTERRAAESGPAGCDLRRALGSLQSVSPSLSWSNARHSFRAPLGIHGRRGDTLPLSPSPVARRLALT